MEDRGSLSTKLNTVVQHLILHRKRESSPCEQCARHQNKKYYPHAPDTWSQLETLRHLLCERDPLPRFPYDIQGDINDVIIYRNSHVPLTSATSIPPTAILQNPAAGGSKRINICCWNGDITTLTNVTAIVNAANSSLLGCFIPGHRCIDNVIHSVAGPNLRDRCNMLMESQENDEPVGKAKITLGFSVPAYFVLHTVGPQLRHRQIPGPEHKAQLASCYHSCLNAAQNLPTLSDKRKVVVFCCISTGLFGFPSDMAARIAIDAVREWYLKHPETNVTDIIFNTFLVKDQSIYQDLLSPSQISLSEKGGKFLVPAELPPPSRVPLRPNWGIDKACSWIKQANALIISAGAGLSAAAGLDYTSHALFSKHFPALHAHGLRRLYDVIGFNRWNSPGEKWGYYFLHLDMVRKWPRSPIYEKLRTLAENFQGEYFIRTSNADGFFAKNGFDEKAIATPQGQYRYLQCLKDCDPSAFTFSDPYVDDALPFIDPESQVLTDESKIPKCKLCGGEMTLCVRGGHYFNPKPFEETELLWKKFLHRQKNGPEGEVAEETTGRSPSSEYPKKALVLELGVGLNTPSVLRFPNEKLVFEAGEMSCRLVRIGLEASGCAPWELEEENLGVGISGDISAVLDLIIP